MSYDVATLSLMSPLEHSPVQLSNLSKCLKIFNPSCWHELQFPSHSLHVNLTASPACRRRWLVLLLAAHEGAHCSCPRLHACCALSPHHTLPTASGALTSSRSRICHGAESCHGLPLLFSRWAYADAHLFCGRCCGLGECVHRATHLRAGGPCECVTTA